MTEDVFNLTKDIPIGEDFIVDRSTGAFDAFLAHVKVKVLFAFEIVVKRALGHVGPGGDLGHVRPRKSPFGKDARRSFQNALLFIKTQLLKGFLWHSVMTDRPVIPYNDFSMRVNPFWRSAHISCEEMCF